jgi:serine/threonine-protein kinase
MKRIYLPGGVMVGRYQLVRPLASGACATVYEALDSSLGRRVALKLGNVAEPNAGGPVEARFLREARAAAQVDHPNVVRLFDAGIEGDLAYLVMELIDGETLADRLKRGGRLGVSASPGLLLPILSAVSRLHAHGVVHRDIKPANILLGNEALVDVASRVDGDRAREAAGCVKLADFGLSRFVAEVSTLTDSGMSVGTPEYMAPEAMRGSRLTGEASDQYSLGVVLYECLTGIKPFSGATSYDLMSAVLGAPVAAPSSLEPSIPRALDAVVLRAMSRDPGDRFPSMVEFAEALARFGGGRVREIRGVPHLLPEPAQASPRNRLRRRGAAATAADIQVGDGLAVATLFGRRRRGCTAFASASTWRTSLPRSSLQTASSLFRSSCPRPRRPTAARSASA